MYATLRRYEGIDKVRWEEITRKVLEKRGLAGAPWWFMLSGLFGIGLGDSAYFQALPRLL